MKILRLVAAVAQVAALSASREPPLTNAATSGISFT
jgi:hypothetical protein